MARGGDSKLAHQSIGLVKLALNFSCPRCAAPQRINLYVVGENDRPE